MPTWRAVTSGRRRLLPWISSMLKPNISEVFCRMSAGVIGRGWLSLRMSASTRSASSTDSSSLVRLA